MSIQRICSNFDGTVFFSEGDDDKLQAWDIDGNRIAGFRGIDTRILDLSPKETQVLACRDFDDIVVLLNFNGKELKRFGTHLGKVQFGSFHNENWVLTGSDDCTAKAWDVSGDRQKEFFHGNSVIWTNLVHDDQLLLTLSDDGVSKLWDFEKELLIDTYYPISVEDGSWLKVNKDNYYMGSKNVGDYIHFKVGLNVYLFEQFDLRLNRPDKVLEPLVSYGLASQSLVNQYRKAYHKRLEKYGFTETMLSDDYHVPECAIENTDELPQQTNFRTVDLFIKATDSLQLLDRLNIYVNDVPIYGISGINLRDEDTQHYSTSLKIQLSAGQNKIQASVLNQGGAESLKATVFITCDAASEKPDLYLAAVGVSDYQAEDKALQYAAKDAEDIADLYQSAEGFRQVHTRTLTDEQVTKANILALRKWLETTTVDDQVMIYVSGHGLLDDNYDFYYATHDVDFTNPSEKGILYDEIEGLLDGIPARKKLLLMDACHSGEFDKDAPLLTEAQQDSLAKKGITYKGFAKSKGEGAPVVGLQNSFEMMQQLFADLRRGSGATVITSSAGVQVSFEDDRWQNGAFTYVFLYGLKTMKADANQDGQVTASELQSFVSEYVPRLTKGLQVPTFRRENLEFDFRVW